VQPILCSSPYYLEKNIKHPTDTYNEGIGGHVVGEGSGGDIGGGVISKYKWFPFFSSSFSSSFSFFFSTPPLSKGNGGRIQRSTSGIQALHAETGGVLCAGTGETGPEAIPILLPIVH